MQTLWIPTLCSAGGEGQVCLNLVRVVRRTSNLALRSLGLVENFGIRSCKMSGIRLLLSWRIRLQTAIARASFLFSSSSEGGDLLQALNHLIGLRATACPCIVRLPEFFDGDSL